MPKPFSSMPGPRCLPILGSVLNYSRFGKHSFDRLHLAKTEFYKLYGKIYKERIGPVTLVQLFDPADCAVVFRAEDRMPKRPPLGVIRVAHKRDGLALGLGALNGEEWYKMRHSVQKLMMGPDAAVAYLPAQNKVADDFLNVIKEKLRKNEEIPDFYNELINYTMESLGTVCFNTRLGCFETGIAGNSEANKMRTSSAELFNAMKSTHFAFPWYIFWRTKPYKQFVNGKRTCNSLALGYTENTMRELNRCPVAQQSDGQATGNLLASLLRISDLSNDDVVSITTELLIGGVDSTTNALSFTLYNLARNPEKQSLLRQELDSHLKPGEIVTSTTLNKLKYLKACLKESFRLNFPVQGGTSRIAEKDLILSDYIIPKGTYISMNNQTMCLQEKYFDKADQFIPERWLKDNDTTLRSAPPHVMLPFGYGPRMCIGRRFAEQEIYLALIKIVHALSLEYHHEDIGMLNRLFTMPDKPLRLKMTPIAS